MENMDRNTAEIIERITTEREEFRHMIKGYLEQTDELKQQLEEAVSYRQILMEIIRNYENQIEHLEREVKRLKEENRQR